MAGQSVDYNKLIFKHLSSEDGLSQRSVTDVLQDKNGYLWFGTRDGLNKYDGDKITIYRHKSNDFNGLTNSWVTSIYQDHNSNLWIGTKDGLNRYIPEKDNFVQYKQDSASNSLTDNSIWSISHVNDSVVGVATNNGLNLIDLKNFEISLFNVESKTNKSLIEDNRFRHILTTKKGDVWLCSVELISVFNSENNLITEIDYPTDLRSEIHLNISPTLFEDAQANIWLGYEKGLAVFNKTTKKFETFKIDDKKIINSGVRTICQDNHGNIWIVLMTDCMF
ncbi:ligand-binding sensor domain-containing protein [Algibacter lectus]|uniref:ligand-binding sensor domain-containing protein n=1 Tax=Algibacter lectus TaxID=221126 RepID=UPI00187CA60B|nr:two-component regulator propeller domain-containing protein [Algibacter lectus]